MARPVRRTWGGLALTVSLGLVVLDGSVMAQTPPRPDPMERFRAADRNQDGGVDREEFQMLMVEAFYFRDKERRGYLLIQEIREMNAEALKAADADGNGRLTMQEFLNAVFKDFEAADANKDGTLTMQEFQLYIRRSGN